MTFGHKIEATLGKMWKLLIGPSVVGMSPPPAQTAVPPSPKEKVQQLLDNLRGRLQEHKIQEAVIEVAKIVVSPPKDPPMAIPRDTPKEKSKEESESRVASSEPASQKSRKKKEKVPIPELEELEEEEESIAEDSAESEEEEEPSTPPPHPKPRRSVNTRSSRKKQPPPIYRSPYASKRQSKIPEKGEGSNKKPMEK